MTLEQLEGELATPRRQQDNQKKHWLRWGLASNAVSLILCAVCAAQSGADGR
jgi:hypothetical protein